MSKPPVVIENSPPTEKAFGGAIEGAESFTRETANWRPSMRSPDQVINGVKPMADARSRDMVLNDGYSAGGAALHRDNIVGARYRLNSAPNWRVLGVDEAWAEEFQLAVESRFNTVAESQDCWLDASRRNTFTGMVRLAVAGFVFTGEVLASAEWVRDPRRPFKTAIQMISPDRLSNPNDVADTRNMRRGVIQDMFGRPIQHCIRTTHPSENYIGDSINTWKIVDTEKPWGRKQIIHIIEQLMPAQTRGISDMVSSLKQMRMTKKFQEVTLQNAVVNATYAAAIESELPNSDVMMTLGANDPNGSASAFQSYLGIYMGALGNYLDGAKNISIDGAKIPHLFPGTKLNMQPVGTPGGVGTGFEESLLRHIAASLGLSYEQFSRDYTKTNYSSARASMNETWKFMSARKMMVADRFATQIYTLWLEEEIAQGNLPLPPGKTRDWFYEPLVKDALSQCSWIGASRGQIDELKETQSAIMRIKSGLSTYEIESARLGQDFRDVFAQLAREKKMLKDLDLNFDMDATKTNASAQGDMSSSGGDENA